MDTNKKIITGIVGFVIIGVLVFVLGGSFISSNIDTNSGEIAQGLDFDSPELNEEKFFSSTKKEMYDTDVDEYDTERYDSLANNLSFLQRMEKKVMPKKAELKTIKTTRKVDKELEMIMALQANLENQQQGNNLGGELEGDNTGLEGAPVEVEKKPLPKEGNFFFGAESKNKVNGKNLVPAETVDQGILKQGSTIAIRTKEPIIIKDQNIMIPKGAVVYGIVQFNSTRLMVNINRYRRDNTLYSINLDTHDFDGREGIHLKSRSVFAIPSNVSHDVYNAAVKTYEQQASLTGTTDPVPLGQIALLSTAKEVSTQLFDKRRVFVPRKYHLWLTISDKNNEKQ